MLTESWARTICGWTGELPEDGRDTADGILAGAARGGMDLRDLAALAAEMQARAEPGTGDDDDPGQVFEDRAVPLETTFGGAGVLAGDLTPEYAAVVATVLDALSAPRGTEDARNHEQRYHDALEEAITSLFAAFNIADGTIISELHRRHRAMEFRKFLVSIDKAVPADLGVHLVCDNYANCNTAEIKTWLARHPRFHVHFTPTGSSWMNLVPAGSAC